MSADEKREQAVQETAAETQEAVSQATEAVMESAKANTDAVENVAENTKAFHEVSKAIEDPVKANTSAAETAAENMQAAAEVAEAVKKPANANANAVESAAENKRAVKEAADAVVQSAKANTNASETASENKKALKAEPKILDTPKESMDDYQGAIDNSLRKIGEGDLVTGTIIAVNEEEATIDLQNYAAGVIRRADFSADPKFSILDDVKIGDEITARVKKTDDGHDNLVLSVRDAAQEVAWEKLKKAMDEKTPIDVKIAEAVKAGVVCYPEGVRAFIPASKLSLSFVEEKDLPSFVGNMIRVHVITCDKKDNKLVLSARDILRAQAEKDRASKVSNVKVGLVTEGKVESLTNFGAFVDLGEGLSGLVHISQISHTRIGHPSAVLKVGDKVKVKVIAIKDGKLSLSMKALDDVMAEEVSEEKVEYRSEGEVTTSLADLLKKAGF